jgi:hypothetical protein
MMRVLLSLGLLLALAAPAAAQSSSPGAPIIPVEARGFFVGGALGGGVIFESCKEDSSNCGDSQGGGAGDLYVGTMLGGPNAILLDAFVVSSPQGENVWLNQYMIAAEFQHFFNQRGWVRAGLAMGYMTWEDDEGDAYSVSQTGFGATLGAGYDVLVAPQWAVDLQLRLGVLDYDYATFGNFAVMVGMKWF